MISCQHTNINVLGLSKSHEAPLGVERHVCMSVGPMGGGRGEKVK